MSLSKSPVTLRETCRVCGSRKLIPILSLGEQYAVGFLDSAEETAGTGPLALILCNIKDGGCGLLQLQHTFDHDLLYRKYWYKSGISTTMVKALGDIVRAAEEIVSPAAGELVVDIGANDGTLLRQYQRNDIHKAGFEPSNLWDLAKQDNATIIHDYFNATAFQKHFPNRKAKIITSISMFYDLEDPNSFVADIAACLDDQGLWIIQMNYLGLMMDEHTYDNISHEHLEYYSLLSLENLLRRHGFEIFDLELNDVNGGSFRLYIRKAGTKTTLKPRPGATQHVKDFRDKELRQGYDDRHVYANYAKEIAELKKQVMDVLHQEKNSGKKIYIYGASTRGLVVLQYCGIDRKIISAAVDKNSDKWGKYIVGTGIQVISFDDYRRNQPNCLLVLPYQFKQEIIAQERDFLMGGGKMIFALPAVDIVTKKVFKD
jgi:NDP-4-keto-2,6-dideoxyhexose 3-C-methyltransferase